MSDNKKDVNKKIYTCTRCGYFSSVKCNVIAHLKKGVVCNPKVKDISREEVLKTFEKPKPVSDTIACPFCEKSIVKTNISRHKKICKKRKDEDVKDEIEILRNQVNELTKRLDNIATTPSVVNNIIHNYYHGEKINRKYKLRYKIIKNYNPFIDIIKNNDGLIIPNDNIDNTIIKEIEEYFINRKEDN